MSTNGHVGNGHARKSTVSVEDGAGSGADASADNSRSCLERFSQFIIEGLENGYGRLGLLVGKYPARFMIGSVIVCMICCIGLLGFDEENRADKLWVPTGAKVVDDKDWIEDNFPSTVRREFILVSDDDILTAKKINALMDIYQDIATLKTGGNELADICIRAGSNCIVKSILEIWAYDNTTIRALTDTQVLSDIKTTKTSKMYRTPIDLNGLLSGIERDTSGDVKSARATLMLWLTEGNKTMKGKAEDWEDKFIGRGEDGHSDLSSVYVLAHKSAEEESKDALQNDLAFLSIGYFLVVVFVFTTMGNYNLLEQRAWVTLGGFVCIGLSIGVAVGLSSAFQQDYGPLQSILPFLLLGIGVDDMFVIVGALNSLPPEEKSHDVPIPQLVSKVLSHAGVSITVTSLTDFVAFLIGATTIIPGLRSFCVYAAVGILALFSLQTIFFTSCLSVDLRRLRQNRDACLCCFKHKEDYEPTKCSQKQFVPWIFEKGLAPLITKLPVKIVVLVATLALFGVNVWGFTKLEQYFNPSWFIPDDSYASKYLDAQDKYWPRMGDSGFIYCGKLPYYNLSDEFGKLNDLMKHSPYITNGTTDSWFEALDDWLSTTKDPIVTAMLDSSNYPTSEANFVNLTYRLATEEATRTKSKIIFDQSSTTIQACRFPYEHIALDDAQDQIDAMDDTIDLITRAGLSSDDCFPYSFFYPVWETNKVIKEELFRNLGLAMLCVFIVGLILIANITTSIFVFIGVIFTLIDVAGMMYFWDLTIDTVTSIVLVLSIGLAVDYSAHIGHMFMRVKGTREERIKETLFEIGPPVFFGGFSTLLAFILLAASSSYAYRTFFKVNFLVVIYGLFHGLVLVPVILSLAGPAPYPNASLVYNNKNRHNKVSDKVNGVGMDNHAFPKEEARSSEMTDLSSMPPINGFSKGQTNYAYQNSNSEDNMTSSSSLPPENSNKSAPSNPNTLVFHM